LKVGDLVKKKQVLPVHGIVLAEYDPEHHVYSPSEKKILYARFGGKWLVQWVWTLGERSYNTQEPTWGDDMVVLNAA
jgi:hypothetical protein